MAADPRAEYDPRREGYHAAQDRRQRAVDIAASTNGYERLRELVGAENFAEFHACVVGMAYAVADRIEPGSEYDHMPQREALRRMADDIDRAGTDQETGTADSRLGAERPGDAQP